MNNHMELHPLCTLFPRIIGSEFEALKADISANGLRQPIIIHEGFILDGGNRYRACMEIGVEPEYVEFCGGNLVSYVLSVNMHRRHLSPGQQAAIVASAKDWASAQTHGGARRGDQAATLPLETVKQRAAESGASERTQRMADKVAKESPELAKKVAHGEISLPKAHKQITPDADTPEIMRGYDPAQDILSDADMLTSERQENAILQAQVEALSKSDHAAELETQIRIRFGIEQQNTANMNKVAQLDKELRYLGKLLAELRKVLRVDSNAEILSTVKSMLREAA